MLARQNKLLALLPERVLASWRPHLSLIDVPKDLLVDLDAEDSQVYFPITAVFAQQAKARSGPPNFLRFTGNSFLVGLVNLLKAGEISFESRVCGAGYALVLPKALLRQQLSSPFLGGNPQAVTMARIAENGFQSSYCMSSHRTSQRLARILLHASDAFGSDRAITLSQQELCELL